MKVIGSYKNGNYKVIIFEDGTKVRANNLNFFRPDMPESMDIKITNMCDMGCKQCHEDSIPDGKHGDIMNLKFIETLHPYTELAIGGGNPLAHPDLVSFLDKCKSLRLIPSMTINQVHFMRDYELVKFLVDSKLIYGLGISLTNARDEKFLDLVKQFPNAVIHVIAGLASIRDLQYLADRGLKILLLGYKQFRRGESLYSKDSKIIDQKIQDLKDNLGQVTSWFDVVSFDNLAIKQLDPKRILTDEEYDEFFMGNDGFATMYVNCVEEEFAVSSTSTERYPIKDNIKDMFEVIRKR